MFKRMINFLISSVVTVAILVPSLIGIFVEASSVYPEGWKYWMQGDSRWSKMSIGNDTVGRSGCLLFSIAKMYVQAGAITDSNYLPSDYVTWTKENNQLTSGGAVSAYATITNFHTGPAAKATKNIIYKSQSVPADNTSAISEMSSLRTQGKLVIANIKSGAHFVLVGDPLGENSLELYGSAGDDPLNFNANGVGTIVKYYVFEVEGESIIPGTSMSSAATTLENEASTLLDTSSNEPLYRLSNYNSEQKEVLAILQNKSMTSYEYAAFKWNMIVSQFAIPYVNGLSDTLEQDAWDSIFRNINDVEYTTNPYREQYVHSIDLYFEDGVKEYLKYLKANKDKLQEVLKLLATDPILTPLYSEDNTIASVNTLLYGNALYLQDNTAISGNAIIHTTDADVIEEVIVNPDSSQAGLQVSNNGTDALAKVDLWRSLSAMYSVTNDSAASAYKSILENSKIEQITLPVYVKSDVSDLYNTLFIANAMRVQGDHSNNTSKFISHYEDTPVYLDNWGNICIKENNKTTIVYPAYANSLLVSSGIKDADLAGIYYEDLRQQYKPYNLTVDGVAGTYYLSNDKSVQITQADAIKHITNYDVDTNTTLGSDVGSSTPYAKNSLSNVRGIPLNESTYDRLGANRLDTFPVIKLDTSTLAYGNKPILTTMSRNVKDSLGDDSWYSELKARSTVFTRSLNWFNSDTYSSDSAFSNSLTLERFGTQVILKQAPSTGISNYENELLLTRWRTSSDGKQLESYFERGTSTAVSDMDALNLTNTSVQYPFHTYTNLYKGMYIEGISRANTIQNYNRLTEYKTKNTVSTAYRTENGIATPLDNVTPRARMLENVSSLCYLDSSRFNIYFTLNTDLPGSRFSFNKTGALQNSTLNSAINNDPGQGLYWNSPYIKTPATNTRMLSIPILSTVVDDTSSWGIWQNSSASIDNFRNEDSNYYTDRGLLEPVEKISGVTNGLKYSSNNPIVSDILDESCVEDILSIAYMWDTYYIPNSPLSTKMDLKSTSADSLYPENTVLTPYNSIEESNILRLFWTRELDSENNILINNLYNSSQKLSRSEVTGTKYVHCINVHMPTLILSINKNASGENLVRWVENLKDTETSDAYIMDLISAFLKNPVTGLKNFVLGVMQLLHTSISKGTLGTFLNIEILSNIFWKSNLRHYFFIAYGVMISLALVIVWINYLFKKRINIREALLRCGKVIAIGVVPVAIISYLGPAFSAITNQIFGNIYGQIIVTDLESAKRGNSKIDITKDNEILLDNLTYESETFSDLNIDMLIDTDKNGVPVYTTVTLEDLYNSICYDYRYDENVLGTIDFDFEGLTPVNSSLWYNSSEFVAVNYDRYDDSVFYYFYDWFKSSYIRYHSLKGETLMQPYNKPKTKDDIQTEELYSATIKEAEVNLREAYGGVKAMIGDPSYIFTPTTNVAGTNTEINTGLSDLLGLSAMFNMTTTTKAGMYSTPPVSYHSSLTLQKWSDKEYADGVLKLSDYTGYTTKLKSDLEYQPQIFAISGIVQSPYWSVYSDSNLLKGTDNRTDMLQFSFTPTYLNAFNLKHKLTSYNNDFNEGWQTQISSLPVQTGQRIPWRIYASRASLERDTWILGKSNLKQTKLESALISLNEDWYSDTTDLLSEYSSDHISDDTLLFVMALTATFKFNAMLSSHATESIQPQGIDVSSLSTDRLFRVMYSSNTQEIVESPNLIYMINNGNGGFFTAIVFSLTEVVLVVLMYVRAMIYLLLIVGIMFVCLSYIFWKESSIKTVVIGFLSQIIILLSGQIALMFVLKLGIELLGSNSNRLATFMWSLVLLAACWALLVWHLKSLIALLKSLKSFGGVIIQGKLQTVSQKFNTARGNAQKQREYRNISGSTKRTSLHSGEVSDTLQKDIAMKRRKQTLKRLEDTDNDDPEDEKDF